MNSKRNKYSSGQSLVQVIVAMSLFGVFALFASVLVSQVQRLMVDTDHSLRIENLHATLIQLMANDVACLNTFGGLTINTAGRTVPRLRRSDNVQYVARLGTIVGIQIADMVATNFTENIAGSPLIPRPYTGFFDLRVSYVYNYTIAGLAKTKSATRVFRIRTNPVGGVWTNGTIIANNTQRCTAESGLGISFDSNVFLSRNRNDLKMGDLIVQNGKLEVEGYIQSHGLLEFSDLKFKTSIRSIPKENNGLDEIRGYSFNWHNNGKPDYGFLAQEVEKVVPEVVDTDPKSHMKSVRYNRLLPILWSDASGVINASDQMGIEITDLKNKIEQLDRKNKGK